MSSTAGHDAVEPRENRRANSTEPVVRAPALGDGVAGRLLALQAGAGNQAVARLMARRRLRRPSTRTVQRYEAGEHAKLGETRSELQDAFAAKQYTVQKGDRLSKIAKDHKITTTDLKAANRDKLKQWDAADGSGRKITGFNAGEVISIPQKPNEMAAAAMTGSAAPIVINGVSLDYGVVIAMGDFFESPAQMAGASTTELEALKALIERERGGGKAVETEEWEKATGGRYLKLAEKNEAHFAPQNKGLVAPTTAGASSANHRSEWERHHKAAIDLAAAGKKDEALMTNAFADHFLTDAFAAGHLVNKRDLMEKFKAQLNLIPEVGKKKEELEFDKPSEAFFDAIAQAAFKGDVEKTFSKYETAEAYALGWNPNINSASRFSILLQGIYKEEPDLIANAVAKGAHDRLNQFKGGLPVQNARGDKWKLSGDGTLNKDTTKFARQAVAQSQLNVMNAYNSSGKIDYDALYKKVWDFTPSPDPDGTKQLLKEVHQGTAINSASLQGEIVKLIADNYKLLIKELVARKKLKKA